jgi:hypothetical protein
MKLPTQVNAINVSGNVHLPPTERAKYQSTAVRMQSAINFATYPNRTEFSKGTIDEAIL